MRLKQLAVILVAALSGSMLTGPAVAHEYEIKDLHIDHPWSRALPPVAKTGAAYLTIENRGEQSDRLLGVSSPVASHAELHEHIHQDGLMKMQQIEAMPIPAGNKVSFKPGSYHIMLFNLKQPLVAGERFPLTLEFEQAGELEVKVSVEQDAPADEHQHH